MKCNKCNNGRVFVDRLFSDSDSDHVELFCVMCGKRWMLDKANSQIAAWLLKIEKAHLNAASVSG